MLTGRARHWMERVRGVAACMRKGASDGPFPTMSPHCTQHDDVLLITHSPHAMHLPHQYIAQPLTRRWLRLYDTLLPTWLPVAFCRHSWCLRDLLPGRLDPVSHLAAQRKHSLVPQRPLLPRRPGMNGVARLGDSDRVQVPAVMCRLLMTWGDKMNSQPARQLELSYSKAPTPTD